MLDYTSMPKIGSRGLKTECQNSKNDPAKILQKDNWNAEIESAQK